MDDAGAWKEVTENIGLVKWATARFARSWPDYSFEELFTAAAIACFKAAKTYNPAKGTRGTFYYTCIRNGLNQEIRDLTAGQRNRTAQRQFSFVGQGDTIERLLDLQREDDGESTPGPDFRNAKRFNEVTAAEFEDETVERMDAPGTAALVRDAVMHLPNKQRDLIVAKFWEGLSFRQIGERYGVTKQAIEQQYRKAETLLRQMLAPLDEEAA